MKDKAMVMNMAVNKALEYVASFVQIEGKYIQEMRKWAREKLAWQGRKKVIAAGWQVFAGKESGGLGIKDPGLVCEAAGISSFMRSALEKDGTVCSRIVEQRIRDNKRLRKMGCSAGAPAAPANRKRRKREARLKGGSNGMVDRVVRTLASMDMYIEKEEGEYLKCGQCIDVKGKLEEVKWEDVWDTGRKRVRSALEVWKRTGVDIKTKEKNCIMRGREQNGKAQWEGEGKKKKKKIKWQFKEWPWPTEGEVTEVNGDLWVWTDGSVCNGAAGAGVFYKEMSMLNEAARVGGAQTISNAELEAVEMAVKKAPIKRGTALVVFTDSQYVIGQIEKAKIGEKIWTHKW